MREGFGEDGAAVTGGWFMTAAFLGAPAVALIGGYYVADRTGSGTAVAAAVGLAVAISIALPSRATSNWHPFAPHC